MSVFHGISSHSTRDAIAYILCMSSVLCMNSVQNRFLFFWLLMLSPLFDMPTLTRVVLFVLLFGHFVVASLLRPQRLPN